MRLTRVRVRQYKSVWDSEEFEIGDVTCLVGKNESGKTALLEALYRLNPLVKGATKFDITEDYPRLEVEDYLQALEAKARRPHADAIRAVFSLDDAEVAAVNAALGNGVLASREIELSRGYDPDNSLYVTVRADEQVAVQTLVNRAGLPPDVASAAAGQTSLQALLDFLAKDAEARQQQFVAAQKQAQGMEEGPEKAAALDKATKVQESQAAKALRAEIPTLLADGKGLGLHIWRTYLTTSLPTFLYFDEYYQMTGQVNVQRLKEREASNQLFPSDRPLLGLIELARLKIDELTNPQNTQQLKNKLQGASNYLSGQILKYWSQNKHLHVQFDLRQALPGDPPEMNQSGTMNLWGEVYEVVSRQVVEIQPAHS